MTSRSRISVLCDNLALPGLAAEWGLSLLVETPGGRRCLWDAGKSVLFLDNARRLGLDLAGLDAVALSHGHFDHGDGLPAFREHTGYDGPIHAHPGHAVDRYTREDDGSFRFSGLSAAARAALAVSTPVEESAELLPGLVMLASIPRREGLGCAANGLYLDPAGAAPDPLPDDACLVLDAACGPVLVLGCCHAGLANTLHQVRDVLGLRRLAAVLGGLHLYNADEEALAGARDALREFGSPRLFPGHCTGAAAARWLAREMPGRVEPFAAGSVLEF